MTDTGNILSPRDQGPKTKITKHRFTRARSGCQRCRAQRRKCDERKPQCGRCTNSDATCEYVTQVLFKTKNSQILSQDLGPAENEPSASGTLYPPIEFIIDDGISGRKASDQSPRSTEDRHSTNHGASVTALRNSGNPGAVDLLLVGQSLLSSAEVQLLKYYSHYIAPWLDVYDEGLTFSRHVTKLAMTSPCILELLLQVSAVSSNRPLETVTRRGTGLFHIQSMSKPSDPDSPSTVLQSICCFVLARTLLFVDKVPETWEPSFEGDGAFRYFRIVKFAVRIQRQIWFALLTLILRLEIAYCLMSRRPPVWIPELAQQIQYEMDAEQRAEDTSQHTLCASVRCLKLLVDAMQLSFASDEETHYNVGSAPVHSRVERWREFSSALDQWYDSRPSNLEPLVDFSAPSDIFPTIIFTNGAGMASNMLYHTAMLLLINSKLRSGSSDERNGEKDDGMMRSSLRWHAHRIYGIAINSEPECAHYWDPSTIAAFSFAAQWAMGSSEQRGILQHMNRLKAAGWHVDRLITELNEKWNSIT